MTKASRSRVVSSFTIVKGAMIEETYAVFREWDVNLPKRENLDRLRDRNFIGARSATWLRDVIKVLNRRFEPCHRDKPLMLLAQQECPMEEWKPLLLWHMTRDEFLLSDFIQHWLFKAYTKGQFRVRPEELHSYLKTIKRRGGKIEHEWTQAPLHRVAAGLLRIAADFDLLIRRRAQLSSEDFLRGTAMSTIATLFSGDVSRRIEEVIKVDQTSGVDSACSSRPCLRAPAARTGLIP